MILLNVQPPSYFPSSQVKTSMFLQLLLYSNLMNVAQASQLKLGSVCGQHTLNPKPHRVVYSYHILEEALFQVLLNDAGSPAKDTIIPKGWEKSELQGRVTLAWVARG